MAMPYIVAASFKIGGAISARTAQNRIRPTTVPITLKERCTRAARFAFLFVPTEESSAVTHVPIFWPMMMGMAAP